MTESTTQLDVLNITADIVCAYVSNHSVEVTDIQSIMQKVHSAVQDLMRHGQGFRKSGPLVPAVPIEESIKDDYIVCLEDGKKLQMLKRHLNTVYKMSVDEYRERWGLAPDYPVVAPNYARRRSQIAKNTGLGQTGRRKRVQFIDKSKAAISQVAAVSK
ncbi:MAG: MucR family transcriptional regulator [Proteobacteria bacterium]|nr:MucR family transcriptional regulator [Pseudomonadota bacterium]